MTIGKKELIIKQRLHWLEMEKKKGEINIDDLAKVIAHLDDFYDMAPNLLNASHEKYERWFEKLYRIDKRALLFYEADCWMDSLSLQKIFTTRETRILIGKR